MDPVPVILGRKRMPPVEKYCEDISRSMKDNDATIRARIYESRYIRERDHR
jgi:hypothetical protein